MTGIYRKDWKIAHTSNVCLWLKKSKRKRPKERSQIMIIKDSGSMTGQYHRRNISGRKSNAIVHDFCNCWQVKRARILIHEQSKIKREWKWKEGESRSVVSDSLRPHGLQSPWNSPGQNTGVGSLSLLQEIFSTQALNPGLPQCRWILYQLRHREALGLELFQSSIIDTTLLNS